MPRRAPTTTDRQVAGGIEIPLDIQSAGFWLHGLMGAPQSSTVKAYGSFTFSAQPANNSTITLNGVTWTFVTGSPTGNQTQIGVDLDATLTALATNLNASVDAEIAKVTYTADTANDQLDMEFDTAGTGGNSWTLAASATSNATRSAATLIGGGSSHVFTAGGATPVEDPRGRAHAAGDAVLSAIPRRQLQRLRLHLVAARRRLGADQRRGAAADASLLRRSTPRRPTYTVTRFSQGNGLIKVGGTQLAYVTAGEFNFTNSPDVVETIRADGLIDGVDMGQARASGSMTVRLSDSATQTTLQNAFEAQTPVVLQYGFAHPLGW